MRGILVRLPVRRLEISFGILLNSGLAGLMWQKRAGEDSIWIAIFILEFMLPITTGIITSGLLADEPVIELLMSSPRPAAHIRVRQIGLYSLYTC